MIAETCTHLDRSSRRFAVRAGVAKCLRRTGFPRLVVAIAILLGAMASWGVSRELHEWGMKGMWLRYPLALAAAYVMFLGVVGFWIGRTARRIETWQTLIRRDANRRQRQNSEVDPELGDWVETALDSFNDTHPQCHNGKDVAATYVMLLAGTIVLVCVYFVWTAPAFLAELLIEGGLVAWLYRPPQRPDSTFGWLTVAFERTAAPALMMAACVAAMGVALQLYVPQANTIAEVIKHARP